MKSELFSTFPCSAPGLWSYFCVFIMQSNRMDLGAKLSTLQLKNPLLQVKENV